MATTSTTPAGLSAEKRYGDEWFAVHTGSGLALHQVGFLAKADLIAALGELAQLGIDWEQPAEKTRGAVNQIPDGHTQLAGILTSPEQRERQRRLAANSTRYLRALETAGEKIIERVSHGLAATIYLMSCGCQRTYSVSIGLDAGEPREDLAARCERHRDLVVETVTTDIATIRRELGRRTRGQASSGTEEQ